MTLADYRGLLPPPRAVPLTVRAAALTGGASLAGTVVFSAGMALFWFVAGLAGREVPFWFAGTLERAPARVIAVEPSRWTHGRAGAMKRYRYEYTTADGIVRRGVSYRTPTQRGSSYEVEFSPRLPSVSRLVGAQASPLGFVGVTTIAFPTAGFFLLRLGVRAGWRAIRLMRAGQLAVGWVSAVPSEAPRATGEPPPNKFNVRFTAAGGQKVTFLHEVRERHDEVGDEREEAVLYDPRDPATAMVADDLPGRPRVGPGGSWQGAGVRPVLVLILLMLALVAQAAWGFVILTDGWRE